MRKVDNTVKEEVETKLALEREKIRKELKKEIEVDFEV